MVDLPAARRRIAILIMDPVDSVLILLAAQAILQENRDLPSTR